MSKEKVRVLELDRYEHGILVNALICFYETLQKENRDVDLVVDLLDRVAKAPYKKSRFKYALEKCEEKQ